MEFQLLKLKKLSYDIKNELFTKIMAMTTKDFSNINIGEYISRIENDVSTVTKFITNDLSDLMILIIEIVVSVFFIFKISPKLSLISISILPINYLITNCVGVKISKSTFQSKKSTDKYYSFLQESLNSFIEIKCLNIYKNIITRYSDLINNILKINFNIRIMTMLSNLGNITISAISKWIITLCAALDIINNKLSIGLFVAFNGYLEKFIDSIEKLMEINLSIKIVKISIDRISLVESFNSEYYNGTNKILIKNGNISLKNVHFSYNTSKNIIINNLSLNIKQNSLNALVGFNGCGKSTILNLISGLYKTQEGQITIDGYNINKVDICSLRDHISYIQQTPFIFNGTIIDNFKIFKKNVTEEEIIEACKLADIDDYIQQLPQKYLTVIGTSGIKLSGGQKQRLAIARAILKNGKILLLDEITANLDAVSEKCIMTTLHKLSNFKTIIMVSHKLTTLLNISNIYVINNGSLVGFGNHYSLINNCEIYKKMYKTQWYNIIKNSQTI